VNVVSIEDIRVSKRKKIVTRAKEILIDSFEEGAIDSNELIDSVRETMRVEKLSTIGEDKIPVGPHVLDSDAIIVVEGRADVINLLRYGIKNAVGVEGTNISQTIIDLCEKKTATAFFDGDRGGDLILQELLQVADIDFVAFAPRGKSVEDLTRKEIIKALRNKVPVEYVKEQLVPEGEDLEGAGEKEREEQIPAAARKEPEGSEPAAARKRGLLKKRPEPEGKQPRTLSDQIDAVRGKKIARFLSPDLEIKRETKPEGIEKAAEGLNGDITGLVTDGEVNQRILDLMVSKGLEYIAAREFKGIIKRPLTIRLIKIA
jgi:DNA primase